MNTERMHIIAGVTMFVLCISLCPTTVNATVVWSDDFNDGTYTPEWTVCDNMTFHDGDYGWGGSNWSATNNYLEKLTGAEGYNWGVISRPSNIAYGTWSFDVKANGTIFFISNNFYDMDDLYEDASSYFMWFDVDTYEEEFTIYLAKRFNDARTILDAHSKIPLTGWNHIDVTRNTTGCFTVYVDGSPIIEVEDTDIDTSEMFWLWFHNGDMIDNIVIYDEVLNIATTTTTTLTDGTNDGGLPTILIIMACGIAVIVLVVFAKRR